MAFADLFVQALNRKKMQESSMNQDQGGIISPEQRLYPEVRPSLAEYSPATSSVLTPRTTFPPVQFDQQRTPQTDLERRIVAPIPDAPVETQHTGGFLSRLKDALIGTALMGPVGGIASLINPQIAHTARYNMIDKPGYQHDTAFNQKLLDQQVQNFGSMAQVTGRIPGIDSPTESAMERQAAAETQRLYREAQQQQWEATQQKWNADRDSRESIAADRIKELERKSQSQQANYDTNKFIDSWRHREVALNPSMRAQIASRHPGLSDWANSAPDWAPEQYQAFPFVDEKGDVSFQPWSRNPGAPGAPRSMPPVVPSGAKGKPMSEGSGHGGQLSKKEHNSIIEQRAQDALKSAMPELNPDNTNGGVLFSAGQDAASGAWTPPDGKSPAQAVREYRDWYAEQRSQKLNALRQKYAQEVTQQYGEPYDGTPRSKSQAPSAPAGLKTPLGRPAAKMMPRAEYERRVKQYGKEWVDQALDAKGYGVQP